jgi:hypothetical protein
MSVSNLVVGESLVSPFSGGLAKDAPRSFCGNSVVPIGCLRACLDWGLVPVALPTANDRSGFRQGTFTGMQGNDSIAPRAVVGRCRCIAVIRPVSVWRIALARPCTPRIIVCQYYRARVPTECLPFRNA